MHCTFNLRYLIQIYKETDVFKLTFLSTAEKHNKSDQQKEYQQSHESHDHVSCYVCYKRHNASLEWKEKYV